MQEHTKRIDSIEGTTTENIDDKTTGLKHPKHTGVQKLNNMTIIALEEMDEMVTQRGELQITNLDSEVLPLLSF